MTLNDLFEKLESHDWFYEYSDDNSVWRRGQEQLNEIRRITARGGPEFAKLYQDYHDSVFSGPAFNCDAKPRPPRPLNGQNLGIH